MELLWLLMAIGWLTAIYYRRRYLELRMKADRVVKAFDAVKKPEDYVLVEEEWFVGDKRKNEDIVRVRDLWK